jgi:hypothetical protein
MTTGIVRRNSKILQFQSILQIMEYSLDGAQKIGFIFAEWFQWNNQKIFQTGSGGFAVVKTLAKVTWMSLGNQQTGKNFVGV